MKYKDWSDFLVHCSGIAKVMARPKNATMPPKKDVTKMSKILLKDELTEDDEEFIAVYEARERRYNDPELSETAIRYLMGRFAWDKYGKKTIGYGHYASAADKGNKLELEAIEILAQLDKKPYKKWVGTVKNEYISGQCDVFHQKGRHILDVKVSWNINSFLPYQRSQLERAYWFQMQGYMELYDADEAEVCFVLVNTPTELIEREREKLDGRYFRGEIARDRYKDELETLSFSANYGNMPLKRRVIRHIIPRYREIIPLIYNNVIKCRSWLNEFEKIHTTNKPFIILPDYYVNNNSKEDNPDADA